MTTPRVEFVVEHEPREPIYNVIHRLPPAGNYRLGTIIRITEGPHAGKRFKSADDQRDGPWWEPVPDAPRRGYCGRGICSNLEGHAGQCTV